MALKCCVLCLDAGASHGGEWGVFCHLSPPGTLSGSVSRPSGDLREVVSVVAGLDRGAGGYVCVYPCVHMFGSWSVCLGSECL